MPTKEKSHIAFCVLDKQMVEATARESKLVAIYCTILLLVGIRMVASPKVLDTVGSRALRTIIFLDFSKIFYCQRTSGRITNSLNEQSLVSTCNYSRNY